MTEAEILQELTCRGLQVDEGNVIGGPFIPDGVVRIYDDSGVRGEGRTLEEAYNNTHLTGEQ